MIVGFVAGSDGEPNQGAVVVLRRVFGGLTSQRGVHGALEENDLVRSPQPTTETDENGGFILYVGMPSTESPRLLDNGQYELHVMECVARGRRTNTLGRHGRYPRGNFAPMVDLRAVGDGNIPSPDGASSFTTTVLDAYRAIRRLMPRMPAIGFTIFPPSQEFYSFLGAVQIDFSRRAPR